MRTGVLSYPLRMELSPPKSALSLNAVIGWLAGAQSCAQCAAVHHDVQAHTDGSCKHVKCVCIQVCGCTCSLCSSAFLSAYMQSTSMQDTCMQDTCMCMHNCTCSPCSSAILRVCMQSTCMRHTHTLHQASTLKHAHMHVCAWLYLQSVLLRHQLCEVHWEAKRVPQQERIRTADQPTLHTHNSSSNGHRLVKAAARPAHIVARPAHIAAITCYAAKPAQRRPQYKQPMQNTWGVAYHSHEPCHDAKIQHEAVLQCTML